MGEGNRRKRSQSNEEVKADGTDRDAGWGGPEGAPVTASWDPSHPPASGHH